MTDLVRRDITRALGVPDDIPSRDTPTPSVDSWVPILAAVGELAGMIAGTEFVPKDLRGKPAAVAASILFGRELGLPPMRSLAEVSVIQGRPSLSANMMRALVFGRGHRITIDKWTDTECRMTGVRVDGASATVTYTFADAQRAGLTGRNPNWKSDPRAMLLARATSRLCRAVFPDVIAGVDTADEAEPAPQARGSVISRKPAAVRPTETAEPAAPVVEPPGIDLGPGTLTLTPDDGPPIQTEVHAGRAVALSDDDPPITTKQSRLLHARLREVGLEDRDRALAVISGMIGRDIDTTKALTVGEASQVIDTITADTPGVTPPPEQDTLA